MKLSAALLLAPFVLLASAAPNANPATAEEAVKEKIAAISVREAAPVQLHARAPVTGTVNANNVRYRRCARTSCEAIGQYHNGQRITITCRVRGESINGWDWWDKMSNGYYISDYYVSWTGGVPDVC
ncbi:hypothetical protein H1R20_g15925, partial [Candolleomyces eurysporus]|uniref:SH3 domain-containing protein n=2 Tax=Candolleomyces TaxID=2791032 RepID=A0A4Q2DXA9_9AGAR